MLRGSIELRDAEPDADKLGLRLEVASGPGEDFRYDLSFDEYLTASFTDEVRTHDGLKVVIPQRDIDRLQGATLDHTDTQGLVIRNPNRGWRSSARKCIGRTAMPLWLPCARPSPPVHRRRTRWCCPTARCRTSGQRLSRSSNDSPTCWTMCSPSSPRIDSAPAAWS